MILRGRDRRRQMSDAELLETRQETFLLLAAKNAKYEFRGIMRPAPRHHRENETGETGVIKLGDTSPALPFGLLCTRSNFHHFRSPELVVALVSRSQRISRKTL